MQLANSKLLHQTSGVLFPGDVFHSSLLLANTWRINAALNQTFVESLLKVFAASVGSLLPVWTVFMPKPFLLCSWCKCGVSVKCLSESTNWADLQLSRTLGCLEVTRLHASVETIRRLASTRIWESLFSLLDFSESKLYPHSPDVVRKMQI
jgi:hypothetical protein